MSDDERQGQAVPGWDRSEAEAAEHKEWLKEMRGTLMVLATLAASVTYQAGLNPPGGFWQDDNDSKHVPGNPVLHDGQSATRYLAFYYFNATAFSTSLAIIMLLLKVHISDTLAAALTVTTVIQLFSLLGAYIAGSASDMPNSIYIIVFACFLFICVLYFGRVLPSLCVIVLLVVAPPLFWLANKGWLPVLVHMKKRVVETVKYCCPRGRAFKHGVEEETVPDVVFL